MTIRFVYTSKRLFVVIVGLALCSSLSQAAARFKQEEALSPKALWMLRSFQVAGAAHVRRVFGAAQLLRAPIVGQRNFPGTVLHFAQARSEEDSGITDFESLRRMIDLHQKLHLHALQLPPLGIPSAYNSNYSVSTNAVDPILISIPRLFAESRVPFQDQMDFYEEHPLVHLRASNQVLYDEVRPLKTAATELAWATLQRRGWGRFFQPLYWSYLGYAFKNRSWIFDDVLYLELKTEGHRRHPQSGWDWRTWAPELRDRNPQTIRRELWRRRSSIAEDLFRVFIADRQLTQLVRYGEAHGVSIIGDQAIAVSEADLWTRRVRAYGMNAHHGNQLSLTQGAPAEPSHPTWQKWQFAPTMAGARAAVRPLLGSIQKSLQRMAGLRIDHALGYYQLYLMSEDVDEDMTLEKLGLYQTLFQLKKAAEEGTLSWDDAQREGLERVQEAMKTHAHVQDHLPPDFLDAAFDTKNPISPMTTLVIARHVSDVARAPAEGWNRNSNVVQKTVFKGQSTFDYLRISPLEDLYEPDMGSMGLYLRGELRPTDSVRIGAFVAGPGDLVISDILRLAQEHNALIVMELLAREVPLSLINATRRLAITPMMPGLFGLGQSHDAANLYHPWRFVENMMATLALQDGATVREWWSMLDDGFRRNVLQELGMDPDALEWTDPLHRALLLEIFKSKARLSLVTWTDILALGPEFKLNDPAKMTGQWENKWPKGLTIEDLLRAADGIAASALAQHTVTLLRGLVESSGRQTPVDHDAQPKLLSTTPAVGSQVIQLRALNTHPFLIDAYVHGSVKRVQLHITLNNGNTKTIAMRKVRRHRFSLFHGVPESISKWTAEWLPFEAGVYPFQIQFPGSSLTPSLVGHLVAIPQESVSTPRHPDYLFNRDPFKGLLAKAG